MPDPPKQNSRRVNSPFEGLPSTSSGRTEAALNNKECFRMKTRDTSQTSRSPAVRAFRQVFERSSSSNFFGPPIG